MTRKIQQRAESAQNISKTHDHRMEYLETDTLIPYAKNAKKHPKKQIHQIAASIRQFGFISPVITDKHGEIIAGHGRWEAAKLLGLKEIPAIRVENLTPAEIKAYRLADNQLTMNSGFDENLLKIEIRDLISIDPTFELEVIGFETAQSDILIQDTAAEQDPADEIPVTGDDLPFTKSSDLWNMGEHRLFCGDSRDLESFQELMIKIIRLWLWQAAKTHPVCTKCVWKS